MNTPKFVSISPQVLDSRRVQVTLQTKDFPFAPPLASCGIQKAMDDWKAEKARDGQPNVTLDLSLKPDLSNPLPEPEPAPEPQSPEDYEKYPTVEVYLVDEENYLVAETMIVPHYESSVEMTLHIRQPRPEGLYMAQAQMFIQNELVDKVEATFLLKTD